MITVELKNVEFQHAAYGGFLRRVGAIANGQRHKYNLEQDPEKSWGMDIESSVAEYVVAKVLGKPWEPGQIGAPDIADTVIEVRSTPRKNGCLLLHKEDADDRIFVLVTGSGPERTLAGWTYGRKGKRPEYWQEKVNNRPCYFVPQDALNHSLGELKDQIWA